MKPSSPAALGDRDEILSRIRRALRVPAPHPGAHTAHDPAHERQPDAPVEGAADGTNPDGTNTTGPRADAAQIGEQRPEDNGHKTDTAPFRMELPVVNGGAASWRGWLPQVGPSWDEQAALFAHNALELKAGFSVVAGRDELLEVLRRLRDEEGWTRIGTHAGELTDLAADALGLPLCRTDGGFDPIELERCEVGITGCDALIAQTGSVLLTSRSAGGRTLSVLPPHHIVLARCDQMVPDLSEAFARLREIYGDDFPSLISFVTGPSRTGDIERILVLGAHGPKKLTVLCV